MLNLLYLLLMQFLVLIKQQPCSNQLTCVRHARQNRAVEQSGSVFNAGNWPIQADPDPWRVAYKVCSRPKDNNNTYRNSASTAYSPTLVRKTCSAAQPIRLCIHDLATT
jgi:hypothetical protein